jgi:hypothetical protein
MAFLLGVFSIGVTVTQAAERPAPELPRTYIDSTYRRPAGRLLAVQNGKSLQAALDSAQPGDSISLDATVTFVGNFVLRSKAGNGWIYIESSAIGSRVHAGRRASSTDAPFMAKIQTPNSGSAISILPGAVRYRLIGLEISPAAGVSHVYSLVDIKATDSPGHLPQNIIIDRCYVHGFDKQDVRAGIVGNGVSVAVVDSYISDIHDSMAADSEAILVSRTPGPIKIANNFLSAVGQEIMFGGDGDTDNSFVPSDIEIRRNNLFKPLAWDAPGITLPPHNKWRARCNLVLKNAQRALVIGNVLENSWMSGDVGVSVLLTVRTSQSGNSAVVNDITVENNILKNVMSGFAALPEDQTCDKQYGNSKCASSGEEKRVRIANNLILFANPEGHGGTRNVGLTLFPGMSDLVFQHNTMVSYPGTVCHESIFFVGDRYWQWPPPWSYTHNIWVVDNVLCRPPTGDWGKDGVAGLTYYMGDPSPFDGRFVGNVMYIPDTYAMQPFPPKNSLQTTITYADPSAANYELVSPQWTQTTDGKRAGVDMSSLKEAVGDTLKSDTDPPNGRSGHNISH